MVINFRNETLALCATTFGFREHPSPGRLIPWKGWRPPLYANYEATLEPPPLIMKAVAAFE